MVISLVPDYTVNMKMLSSIQYTLIVVFFFCLFVCFVFFFLACGVRTVIMEKTKMVSFWPKQKIKCHIMEGPGKDLVRPNFSGSVV